MNKILKKLGLFSLALNVENNSTEDSNNTISQKKSSKIEEFEIDLLKKFEDLSLLEMIEFQKNFILKMSYIQEKKEIEEEKIKKKKEEKLRLETLKIQEEKNLKENLDIGNFDEISSVLQERTKKNNSYNSVKTKSTIIKKVEEEIFPSIQILSNKLNNEKNDNKKDDILDISKKIYKTTKETKNSNIAFKGNIAYKDYKIKTEREEITINQEIKFFDEEFKLIKSIYEINKNKKLYRAFIFDEENQDIKHFIQYNVDHEKYDYNSNTKKLEYNDNSKIDRIEFYTFNERDFKKNIRNRNIIESNYINKVFNQKYIKNLKLIILNEELSSNDIKNTIEELIENPKRNYDYNFSFEENGSYKEKNIFRNYD